MIRLSKISHWLKQAVPALVVLTASLLFAGAAFAQGVTTGNITGIVTDNQKRPVAGAEVVAIHTPSGTTYESVTRADGRFIIPGMRVGGPYTVVVSPATGVAAAFQPERHGDGLERCRLQLQAHRCGDDDFARPAGHAADGHRAPRRHDANDAAVVRHFVRRSGSPLEQHHRRRVLFQQFIRSAQRPG